MKNWISFPRAEGRASRQAHADMPAGTYEREISKDGFFGPATQMHHTHPPTGWTQWQGDLRPRAFDLTRINHLSNTPWEATELLYNAHVRLRYWRMEGRMDALARNGDGDELIFVHEGEGHLFCDYGHLAFRAGDYIMLPRGTMWRIEASSPVTALLAEATNDSYSLPDKGLVGRHAIFDPAVLDVPAIDEAFHAQQGEHETRVVIKRNGAFTTVTYPFNPLDAVGWHGDLAPVRLNWRDIRPLMSHRVHLPPSAHTTFLAGRFVVCTFTPRPAESDPGALKLPFFHNNDDYDEAIFYHHGKFMSRDNIHPGMMTLHPCGFTHGPHPKAWALAERAKGGHMLDEVAVMFDTRDSLTIAEMPQGVEWRDYVDSWKARPAAAE
ncbi:MAG: homogentisate 1,2-dioxygenase [Proteobacteria bacterium]|nr:homogentisate 1,2-dioxygenase [Pseudomonadota bacterium]